MRISLDGDWQLVYFPEGQLQVAHPDDLASIEMSPIPARVPGSSPFSRERYRAWLQAVPALPRPFNAEQVAR